MSDLNFQLYLRTYEMQRHDVSVAPGKGAPALCNFFSGRSNEYADEFMADYKRRTPIVSLHDFDVRRVLELDNDLAAFFKRREL
ncbi:TPA: hypothetical protein N3A33_003404 [Salmonella enterica subsp. salamae serovar 28:r:e,n,z15]|nr:hypothetical protein [Salmonella enterica subsp. salamae serovar 28:r:e,n,z15]